MTRIATHVYAKDTWPKTAVIATATLEYDQRYRRRIQLRDDNGDPFLLNLAQTTLLHDGDAVAINDMFIEIKAAAEKVLDITCAAPDDLARIAYHLGNRHVPVQVVNAQTLRIRDDHVLYDMLARVGVSPVKAQQPFCPEQGAYHHDG